MQDEAEAYKIHIESEKKKASRAQETLTQLSAEKEESHHNLEEGYRKLLHEKECIEKQNQSQQILIEKQRLKIENLEKELQQKGILKELHSPIDQRYDKPTSKEPLKDSQTTKIQDHSQQTLLTTATKDQIVGDFTEQVKNLHPRSHTEASVACQFVDTPMNNSHTKVSVNDQLAKDQPPETPVQGITNSQLKVTKRLLSKQLLEKFKPTEQEHLSQSRPTATTKQIPEHNVKVNWTHHLAQSKEQAEPQKHSTEFTSLHTPFGVRRQSIRRKGPEKKPAQNNNVDSELQSHFAKRQLKIQIQIPS